MTLRQPPKLANWILDRLGYTSQNPALAGDMLEEFRNGRSRAWYWRQTFVAITAGVEKNAFVQRRYLAACLAGFAAQVPVVYALWLFDQPSPHQGLAWALLEAALLFLTIGLPMAWIKVWITRRPATADLRLLLCTEGLPNPGRLMALVAFDKFTGYFGAYCACSLFLPHFSLNDFAAAELTWFALFLLGPALVRIPSAPRAAAAEKQESVSAYCPQELGLQVTLGDRKTIFLAPDTVVESVFATGDEELAAAIFKRGTSLELLRRAIWLGSARKDLATMRDPNEPRAICLSELIALIDEAARTKTVERALFVAPPENFRQRLFRRLRSAARRVI